MTLVSARTLRVVGVYADQLALVQAEITRRLTPGAGGSTVESYSIAGRSLSKTPLRDLFDLQKSLGALASRESRGGGIRVRLGTPT
jgi:hypothetical protein